LVQLNLKHSSLPSPLIFKSKPGKTLLFSIDLTRDTTAPPNSGQETVNTQSAAHSTVHIADSAVAHTAGTTSVHTAPQPADQSHKAALHTAT